MFGRNLLDVQTKDNANPVKEVKSKEQTAPAQEKGVTNKTNSKISPHMGCPHVNDIILVISETTNAVSDISEIKYKGCISEQLVRADQHLIRMRTILQSKYRSLLSKKSIEQSEISGGNLVAYKYYQALTRIMIQDIKDFTIMVALLNNHLAEFKNRSEYDAYIDRQFESVKDVINDTTIDMYMGDWVINQSAIMDLHYDTFNELKSVVSDLFNDARDIAIRSQDKINSIEKKLKDFVIKIVGINGHLV
jgi:hypothetical protein